DHHVIGDRAFARQRNGDDIDGLVVVERSEHQIMQTRFTRGLTLNATVSGGNRRQSFLLTWWCDHMHLSSAASACAMPLMIRPHRAAQGKPARATPTPS